MKNQKRYIEVKNHILKGIKAHQWLAGEQIPSENDLVKVCDVSRMTARRALKELTTEGVLFSRQGQGTFVASAKSRSSVMTIRNIADEIRERGNRHHCNVVNLKKVNKAFLIKLMRHDSNHRMKENILNAFEEGLYFSRIIHFENEIAIQLEERFVNPTLGRDYLTQDFNQITPNEYLINVCPISDAEHRIEAVMASPEQQVWLNVVATEPCLKISRTTWSDNVLASFAYLYHPGTRYQLGNKIKLREEISHDQ